VARKTTGHNVDLTGAGRACATAAGPYRVRLKDWLCKKFQYQKQSALQVKGWIAAGSTLKVIVAT
jgi:hypothetical protein